MSSLRIHNLSAFLERHTLDFQPLAAPERIPRRRKRRNTWVFAVVPIRTLWMHMIFCSIRQSSGIMQWHTTQWSWECSTRHSPYPNCRSQSKLNAPWLVIFRVSECLYLGRVLLVMLCESSLHIRAWRVIPLEENLTYNTLAEYNILPGRPSILE